MMESRDLPLHGLLVVDLSQFLAGPYCSLRLLDMGARVIKIERPGTGDLSRSLYLSDTRIDEDSTIFHAINRGKESLSADLKCTGDLTRVKRLISEADVMIQNFRPGVIERLGLGYEDVRTLNSNIIYASISGYGEGGPWSHLPGQDLLAQARSGLMWLNGGADDGPVPFGLPVADMLAGANAAHGILAALVKRAVSGQGALIETSLLEALTDFQFEVLATHMNDGGRPPRRSTIGSAHAYLGAPYGVYPTADGHLAIAMTPIGRLADLLEIEELRPFADNPSWTFDHRDQIKQLISAHLKTRATDHWLAILEPADIWCSKVMDWQQLFASEAFQRLEMVQTLPGTHGDDLRFVRSPIRVNGRRPAISAKGPKTGQDTDRIIDEFGL